MDETENEIANATVETPAITAPATTHNDAAVQDAAPVEPLFGAGDAPPVSFADKLYEEINNVIGGDNANQFFCMGLPGTLIDASQYTYDIGNNQPKPPHVRANESKLVNKLFDACRMTASDNGRQLQTQYKTALDMLTPKLNGKLFDAKTKLREVLMTPYPYNFGDGSTDILTLDQVFYRLYNEYVNEKQKWAQKQLDKRNELARKYPAHTGEDYRARDDEFIEWYETVAASEVLAVEEKLGQVLNVFSPGDMEIINGILDSGVGREIAEARSVVSNVGMMNPDGGFVYPVTLYPENWFTLLDTSFTAVDLLESPAALAQRMQVLTAQHSNLTLQINTFMDVIPDKKEVEALKKAYTENEAAFQEALVKAQAQYTDCTVLALKTAVDVYAANKEKPNGNTGARIFGVEPEKAKKIIEAIGDGFKKCFETQSKLVNAAQAATNAAMEYFKANNLLQLRSMLLPLNQQLENVKNEITQLQEKIKLSTVLQPKTKEDGTDEANHNSVAPNHVPENFTQLIITSKLSEANQASSSSASSSSSSYGVSFFFGGYSSKKSHSEAVSSAFSSSMDTEIQIGMSLAKVRIGREWFNPGVFLLTADMYNTSSKHIAPSGTYKEFTPARFTEMNQCVLPCFPTAFVIARDVTIKFTTATAMSSSFAQSVEDHSSSGGGFFIFSGSSSSSSSSSSSKSQAKSTANSVTVRFTNPQIIGYYLEATPADQSVSISSAQSSSNADFISVFEFIEKFRKMLDDHNQKYNRASLRL